MNAATALKLLSEELVKCNGLVPKHIADALSQEKLVTKKKKEPDELKSAVNAFVQTIMYGNNKH
jgi:hypothetical protein